MGTPDPVVIVAAARAPHGQFLGDLAPLRAAALGSAVIREVTSRAGATGRLIVTLLHALKATGLSRGVASLWIGGGEATSIAIERPAA